MFSWAWRNRSTRQLAERERVEQSARHQVASLITELVVLFRDLPNVTGPRVARRVMASLLWAVASS